jgi:HPt (histidine-containing phosphotransfer) domain-containing protein
MDPTDTFEPSALDLLGRMGPPGFTSKMIDLFLSSTSILVDMVEKSSRSGDWGGVAFAAHSLKSSAGNLGLSHLTRQADEIDRQVREGNTEAAARLAGELRSVWDAACAALRDYRSRT